MEKKKDEIWARLDLRIYTYIITRSLTYPRDLPTLFEQYHSKKKIEKKRNNPYFSFFLILFVRGGFLIFRCYRYIIPNY